MLKIRTREVLYERYRTEKLLARRATRNISQDETRRMFAGAPIPQLSSWTCLIVATEIGL